MDKLNELFEALGFDSYIEYEDIPNIDLYMDQVIQLFENTYNGSTRSQDEKILTKTMINNYAKSRLFFPVKNKKYTKEHIILFSLIYQLKGALSINDIKTVLKGINDQIVLDDFETEAFYQVCLNLGKQNTTHFKNELVSRGKEVKAEGAKLSGPASDHFEKVLLIFSLVNMSNMYRRVAEKLVDQLSEENQD